MSLPSTYETVIRPNQSWIRVDWRGILQYRDLIFLMVRRDFLARYKQTILGPAWFIVNPIVTSLMFTLVFSRVLGVGTGGVPAILFYLSGMLGWSYFSNLVNTSGSSLLHNASLFGKVYFPRLIVPIALSISNCISFSIQLGTFLVVLAVHVATDKFQVPLSQVLTGILILPALLLHVALLALGVGLTLASITAKYRDFQHLIGFSIQLWMYVTPVIYPFGRIQERFPDFAWVAALNPMSAVVETMRHLMLGTNPMPLPYYVASVVVSIVIFMVGLLMYQRTARTFIDTV